MFHRGCSGGRGSGRTHPAPHRPAVRRSGPPSERPDRWRCHGPRSPPPPPWAAGRCGCGRGCPPSPPCRAGPWPEFPSPAAPDPAAPWCTWRRRHRPHGAAAGDTYHGLGSHGLHPAGKGGADIAGAQHRDAAAADGAHGGFSLLQSWRRIHSCTVGICRSSISVTMTMCSLMVTP